MITSWFRAQVRFKLRGHSYVALFALHVALFTLNGHYVINQILDGCKKSETVDEIVAQDIQNTMLQNIANMGISSEDGDDGLVANFNSLTTEELA